jgi:hypothetical protein
MWETQTSSLYIGNHTNILTVFRLLSISFLRIHVVYLALLMKRTLINILQWLKDNFQASHFSHNKYLHIFWW